MLFDCGRSCDNGDCDNCDENIEGVEEIYDDEAIINGAQALEMTDGNTVVVVVDVNRPVITECPELLRRCKNVVVIDHHRAGKEVIENPTLSHIETMPSSACEPSSKRPMYIPGRVRMCSTSER